MRDDGAGESPSSPRRPGPSGRLSALARASAIVGVISFLFSCCGGGLGASVAVVLGMIALDRIRNSGGALRGKAAAWTGISLGVASLLATLALQWTVSLAQESINTQLDEGVRKTFAAVDAPGRQAALERWAPPAGITLTGDAVERFATTARERYGGFSGFTVTSYLPEPSMTGEHRIELAVKFEFSDATVPGSIVARAAPDVRSLRLRVALESMRIGDLDHGELALGAPASAPVASPPAPTPTPQESTTEASSNGGSI